MYYLRLLFSTSGVDLEVELPVQGELYGVPGAGWDPTKISTTTTVTGH